MGWLARARGRGHDGAMPSPVPTVDVPAALHHLRGVPGPMAALIDAHGPPAMARTKNTFASLGRAIVYQQLSGKAAGTIYGRFLGLYPNKRFPTPAELLATPFESLRGVGLSRGKASYLLDLAAKYADGTIQPRKFSRLSSEELVDQLTRVKGIGEWSVHMFLMFGLSRPDVLPVGDLGVRKGVQAYFGLGDLPAPKAMVWLSQPWQPYRSVASWYMWRIAENGLPGSPDR
jgi:DNA-3-methyladenine glycosylase II